MFCGKIRKMFSWTQNNVFVLNTYLTQSFYKEAFSSIRQQQILKKCCFLWGVTIFTQFLIRYFFFYLNVFIFFLFHHEHICCGYSLEVPQLGTSNEYPQHMFSWRNQKNIYLIPTLIGPMNYLP